MSFGYNVIQLTKAVIIICSDRLYVQCLSHLLQYSNWEWMLYDGKYLTDDEFLFHFHMDQSCVMQLNRLVEDDQEFRSVSGKLGKRSSMLHIMVSQVLR